MRETAVESHPFRKVREKDGAPGQEVRCSYMEPPKTPWYTELENAVKPLTSPETVDQKAIRLLNEQLNQLANIRGLSCDDFNLQHGTTAP